MSKKYAIWRKTTAGGFYVSAEVGHKDMLKYLIGSHLVDKEVNNNE